MLVQFYNRMRCGCPPVEALDEIPPEAMQTLGFMDYRAIVEPLIAGDLENGLSERFCERRYGLGRRVVRGIRAKYRIPG